ncbi:MAG: hypothetical protein GX337_05855 [Christensenellaceae bacterium]|nr:hypothetical protein [Christensenellaceae bacterium]
MPIDYFKTKALSLMPSNCLLQRDRKRRALFFSDFPERFSDYCAAPLIEGGFSVDIEGSYALITPTYETIKAFIDSISYIPLPPADDGNIYIISCVNMLRRHKGAFLPEHAYKIIEQLHMQEIMPLNNVCSSLMNDMAVALRRKTPVPFAGGELLLYSYIKRMKEEKQC